MPRQPAIPTPLRVQRSTLNPVKLHRLDRAYQLLLSWARTPPKPQLEDHDARSLVRSGVRHHSGAKSNP
jgi:hypothetical protein